MNSVLKRKIFFRADGNSQMGLGHIVRCGALANSLVNSFETILLTKCKVDSILQNAKNQFSQVYILDEDALEFEAEKISDKISSEDILVLDGYYFDTNYQEYFRQMGCSLVCIDDIHQCHFVSNCIINHSLSAKKTDYSAENYTKFYLGLDYALLRKSFLNNASSRIKNHFSPNNNVFISLGGADPNNNTLKIIQDLASQSFKNEYEFHVVFGSGYQFFDDFIKMNFMKQLKLLVYRNLSEVQMINLMSKCSIAITSPSTVAIEFISVGGGLYLKCIADNQNEFYKEIIKEKGAFPIEDFGLRDLQDHKNMFRRHCELIDGKQKERHNFIFQNL